MPRRTTGKESWLSANGCGHLKVWFNADASVPPKERKRGGAKRGKGEAGEVAEGEVLPEAEAKAGAKAGAKLLPVEAVEDTTGRLQWQVRAHRHAHARVHALTNSRRRRRSHHGRSRGRSCHCWDTSCSGGGRSR